METHGPKELVKTVTSTEHKTETYEDSLGNPVVIPGGFKYAGKPEDTVQDGIIIADDEGNEFVWIPVSNIDGDNDATTQPDAEDLIKLKDNKKVEITLGRYTFAGSDQKGKEELKQKGSEREKDIPIDSDFKEYTGLDGTNNRENGGVGAKSLEDFVTSVRKNHGYYLARYEAGKSTDGKVVSKKGAIWSDIKQSVASEASKNMYSGEDSEAEYVESDLVNSYAWDTAIVYIQAVGNENYANANRETTGNKSGMMNTGETGDEVCHIFDMAANAMEWSTEYSAYGEDPFWDSCVFRGADCDLSWQCTGYRRHWADNNNMGLTCGFRPILYLK